MKNMNTSKENRAPEQKVFRDQLTTVSDLEELRSKIFNDFKCFIKEFAGMPTKKWLKSYEVKKLLGISMGTLQNLRVNGTLPFTKIGGVILYDYDDVQRMIQENKVDKRSQWDKI
jgi:hypothetical protein